MAAGAPSLNHQKFTGVVGLSGQQERVLLTNPNRYRVYIRALVLSVNRLLAPNLIYTSSQFCKIAIAKPSLLNPPYRGGYVLVAGADLRLNDLTGAVATAALPPFDEPVAIRYPCESAFALTNKR